MSAPSAPSRPPALGAGRGKRKRTGEGRGARWFRLEAELLLLDAEERRRPALRAFRDARRPLVYDRHLVLATDPPEDPGRDLQALDAYYRETRALQWSFVGEEGSPVTRSWVDALEGLGLSSERLVLMERAQPPPRGWSFADPGIERLGPASGFAALGELMVAEAARGEGDAAALRSVAAQLVSLYQARALRHDLEALVVREEGAVVSSILLTLPAHSGGSAWLEDLATRTEARGRGHATRLFRAATALAFAKGAAAVGLGAVESDWTWRWYAREGFAVAGMSARLRRMLAPPAG